MRNLSEQEAMAALTTAIAKHGTQAAFADAFKMSRPYVSDMVSGRKDLSKKILDALGLERVVTYRRKPKP